MPELPEVEVIVRSLRDCIVGETICDASVGWLKTVATHSPEEFAAALRGQIVEDVQRRAKFIIVRLTESYLVCHLRMTGRLISCADLDDEVLADPHTHVVLEFESGNRLAFRDVRKFGRIHLVSDPEQALGDLGVEPLSDAFTAEHLRGIMARHRRTIKPALLDQSVLAGLGNIYVDESLWEAMIHPRRHTDSLTEAEVIRLHAAIRHVLSGAIANGGTTLRDYRNPSNQPGSHQEELMVYHRQGSPCKRCGHPIERTLVGGRGTHYCPVCQAEGPVFR